MKKIISLPAVGIMWLSVKRIRAKEKNKYNKSVKKHRGNRYCGHNADTDSTVGSRREQYYNNQLLVFYITLAGRSFVYSHARETYMDTLPRRRLSVKVYNSFWSDIEKLLRSSHARKLRSDRRRPVDPSGGDGRIGL